MTRILGLITCATLLTACSGNPLSGVMTLSDVSVAEDTPSVAISAAPQDTDADDPAVAAALKAVEADAPNPATGFFSNLFGRFDKEVSPPVLDETPSTDDRAEEVTDQPQEVDPESEAPAADVEALTPQDVPAPKQAGFFARIFSGSTDTAPTPPTAQEIEQTPTPVSNTAATTRLASLFRMPAASAPTGPDAKQVPMNTQLPFGEIATNCEVGRRDLGTKVGEDAGYTLYDTIPNATVLRTHYITGFKDRCARQFTAATSIFGDIGTHEVVRYLPGNRSASYSQTDNAYEELKASFCGVGRGQPCGSRLDRFARRTLFVTAYKRFTSSPDWANILLHDGRVVAMGPK